MAVRPPSPRSNPHEAGFSAGGRRAATTQALDDESGADGSAAARARILAQVARDARLDRKYLLLIVLATAIATLGLLQNSPAVVIGAMLVSPLLGPIMGLGFGLATVDPRLLKRSATTLGAGVAVAIAVAMLIIWISPIQDVTGELRARTQPTLLDLAVAVVGGIAGVIAIMRKLSGVMVGVAIATALVPPLSTIAFGLATWRPDFALGALLLFMTNTLAIAFAATAVARVNRFGPSMTPQHTALQVIGILVTLGVLAVPLALSLNGIVSEVRARTVVQDILVNAIGDAGRIDGMTVNARGNAVQVDAVLLVDRYNPRLQTQIMTEAQQLLGRQVNVTLVQLRRETRSGVEQQDSINQRLSALERRDGDSRSLLRTLTAGDLISRDRIVIDVQARRVMITRQADGPAGPVVDAEDRIIARGQAEHPDWVVRLIESAE